MKTHRCKELLKYNKNYKLGDDACIKYGYQYENSYNKKNKNYKGWWLNFLEIDWDWDVKFMKPIMAINYCPFCGVKLNVE